MIRPRHALIAGMTLLLTGLAACSSTGPGPRPSVETLDPIPVEGANMSTLTIADVYVSLEPDTRLGYHHEGAGNNRTYDYRWGPNFSAETDEMNDDVIYVLTDTGYRMAPWVEGNASSTDTVEPVIQLKPIIDLLELNSYSDAGGYSQAYCHVIWELFRPGEKKPFFTAITSGYNRQAEHSAGTFLTAFERALKNLLAEEDFVAAVSAGQ